MLASVLRLCANGVVCATESKLLPLSLKASLGSVFTSRRESRLLRNGTARVTSRSWCVRFTVLSEKSTAAPVRARLNSANFGGSDGGLPEGLFRRSRMSSMSYFPSPKCARFRLTPSTATASTTGARSTSDCSAASR